MTVYVGSTAGACDVGKVRLRATLAAASGTMKIGETSEIDWTDNDYLTVVDEFGLWPRHILIDSAGDVYMDYDVAYSDQHEDCDPVPVMGPDAVAWLTGATVSVEFDWSDSWVSGSTISSYASLAPGASATSGLATATPTITYNAAGTYRVSCTATAANGKTYTGYRNVFVYDSNNMPATVMRLNSCSGDWSSGGWSFNVTMWDEATRVELLERAKVILFARDWYGGDETAIGPIDDRENIIAAGWIENESIDWNPEQGNVSFTVRGPNYWLNKMSGFPSGIEDYDGTPRVWTEFEDLTVDKGLWHFLHWRTTATNCLDFTLTGDSRQISVFDAPPGSLWRQIDNAARQTILARPCCDRFGRLFVEIDSQFLAVADRAAIPTVQTILKTDMHGRVSFARTTVAPTSMLDLSGVAYSNGDDDVYFALSPGRVFKRYGSPERMDRVALTNQADTNTLAGLVLGNRNNVYPAINAELAANNRAFDVCPHQYGVISVEAGDTERGIVLTDEKIIARRVNFSYDDRVGTLLTAVEFEAYTTADIGITGDAPATPPSPSITIPSVPTPLPEPTPPDPAYVAAVMCEDQFAITFNREESTPDWYNFDPGGDLVGVFQNFVIGTNGHAYCTTRDDSDMTHTGLWHCADITEAVAGTLTWTLIVPADGSSPSITADTGYNNTTIKGTFGSLSINSSNVCHALIHSYNTTSYPPTGTSGFYYVSEATPTFVALPIDISTTHPYYCAGPNSRSNHIVWGWAGSTYACVRVDVSDFKYFIFNLSINAVNTILTKLGTAANNGYYRTWDAIDDDNLFGQGSWNLTTEGIYNEIGGFGITTDWQGESISEYLYQDSAGAYDLYHNVDGLIGDASVEFGSGIEGGMAAFEPGDTDKIWWVSGDVALFSTKNVIIYTSNGGTTWASRGGTGATSLQSALGSPASWTGWDSAILANSILRVVDI